MSFLAGFVAGIVFTIICLVASICYIGGEYQKFDARQRGLL